MATGASNPDQSGPVCGHCSCALTPELVSPEKDCCGVCYAYLQDLQREQEESMVQVTREMAMDGGCPEMAGHWIPW